MSHYSRFQTKFVDRASLVKALADVGYTCVEQHTEAQHLHGYRGDQRADLAHIIVRRQFVGRMSNDIGFVEQADGSYQAIISDFDKRKHDTVWLQKLTQRYAVHATLSSLTEQGYELAQMVEDANGSIRLVLNDYSIQ